MEECLALSSVSMHKRKYPILYWKASHCCPMASRDENFLWVSICGGRKTLWSYPHNQRINRRKTIIEYFSLFMVLSPNPPPKLEGLNFLQGIRKMELLGENPVQCCSNRLRDFQFSPRLAADKYKLHFFFSPSFIFTNPEPPSSETSSKNLSGLPNSYNPHFSKSTLAASQTPWPTKISPKQWHSTLRHPELNPIRLGHKASFQVRASISSPPSGKHSV